MNAAYVFSPNKNVFGRGAISVLASEIKNRGAKKALIVTDEFLAKTDLAERIKQYVVSGGATPILWGKVHPNPTDMNVVEATDVFKSNQCDLIISLGGGSSHDCAKAVAIMATNPGRIHDYEGVDKVQNTPAPLFSVNTTSGTAAEMTRFSIITDTARKVKMAIIDWRITPLLSINDPETLVSMPKSLTAATGMDALTHAIEAFVSTWATPLTDANALTAIKMIFANLPRAFDNGNDIDAREKMAYAQYMAGVAFNNAGLGYVHAMAHQLGGFYDLPHGVCNAILLPAVEDFNKRAAERRLAIIADEMKFSESSMSNADKANVVIEKIKELKDRVQIPKDLRALNVSPSDFEEMAKFAMKDPCGFTNPVQPTLSEVISIFEHAYDYEHAMTH